MFSYMIIEKFFLLKNLVAVRIKASVNLAIEVDKAVDPQLFFHFETQRTILAFEKSRIHFLVRVNIFLMSVSCCGGRKESGAI